MSVDPTPGNLNSQDDPYKTGAFEPQADTKDAPPSAQDTRAEAGSTADSWKVRCPQCHAPIQLTKESAEVLCPGCGSSFHLRDAQATDTTSGMKQMGKFQLMERLGLGAFGAVWKARDTELDRIVALKIPHTGLLTEAEEKERFQREARAAAQLRHPNIVSVHEVATLNELPVIVAEYVAGVPLKDMLDVRPLSFRESAAMIAQLADALEYAHAMGVIHRDIKPANIMILRGRARRGGEGSSASLATASGSAKADELADIGKPMILDFGLALRNAGSETRLTIEGHILGTPAYMSPEQAAGKSHEADRRSDVYSLGVVFYQMLTGELPFRGSRVVMLDQVMNEEPRSPRKLNRKVPRDLETICLKCLAKAPAGRYATAGELAEDLRRFLAHEPILARPVSRTERLVKWTRRRPAVAGLVGVSILALLALLAGALKYAVDLQEQDQLLKKKVEQVQREEQTIAEKKQAQAALEFEKKQQRILYAAKLKEASTQYEGSPSALVESLRDEKVFPPQLREFSWRLLMGVSERSILPSLGEGGGDTVAFSPDGQTVATGNPKGKLRVRRPYARQPELLIQAHTGIIRALAFSPDGKTLATGGADRTIILWNAITGERGKELKGHVGQITCLAFAPGGQTLASTSLDGSLRQWDVATGQGRVLYKASGFTCLTYAADGKTLAVGLGEPNKSGHAVLLDTTSGKERAALKGHSNTILAIVFPADKRFVTTLSSDGTVKQWDAETGAELRVLVNEVNVGGCGHLTPDGTTAVLGQRTTIKVFSTSGGRELSSYRLSNPKWMHSLAISRDGAVVASSSGNGDVVLHNLPLHERTLRGHTGTVYATAIAPDGRTIATGSGDSTNLLGTYELKVWDRESATEQATLQKQFGGYYALAYSPDGATLAVGSGLGPITLWDTATRKLRATLEGHVGPARSIAFAPDGKRLVSSGKDKSVRVWDLASKVELRRLKTHTDGVPVVACSPDGKWLASASEDKTVKLWDAENLTEHATLDGHADRIFALAFSPDSQTLASGAFDSKVILWDVASAKPRASLLQPLKMVKALAFAPDGNTLAVGGDERFGVSTIQLWDPVVGCELITLKGHSKGIASLAFDRDGNVLASASMDGTVKLWEARGNANRP